MSNEALEKPLEQPTDMGFDFSLIDNPARNETRKAVTFRLQPAIIDRIRTVAADTGCSMADLIEDMVAEMYP